MFHNIVPHSSMDTYLMLKEGSQTRQFFFCLSQNGGKSSPDDIFDKAEPLAFFCQKQTSTPPSPWPNESSPPGLEQKKESEVKLWWLHACSLPPALTINLSFCAFMQTAEHSWYARGSSSWCSDMGSIWGRSRVASQKTSQVGQFPLRWEIDGPLSIS